MEWRFSLCFYVGLFFFFLKSKVFKFFAMSAWSGQTLYLENAQVLEPPRRRNNTQHLPSRPLESKGILFVLFYFVVFNRKCDDVPLTNLT